MPIWGPRYTKPTFGTRLNDASPFAIGLTSAYTINEGAGSVLNDVGLNNYKGTLGAGVTWASGQLGRCLSFNAGTTAFVSTGKPSAPGSMTYACWYMLPTSINATQYLMGVQLSSGGGGRFLRFVSGSVNAFQFQAVNDAATAFTAQSATGITAGQWVLGVGVLDLAAGAVTIYTNGVQTATTAITGTFAITLNSFTLGARPDVNANNTFSGSMALATVYNRALSAGEVAALYNDPWQIFAPSSFNWLLHSSAPTFLPAWAAQSTVIGSGVY